MITRFTVRWAVAVGLIITGIFAVLSFNTSSSTAEAARDNDKKTGLFRRTSPLPDDYPRFWDIREAKGAEVSQLLEKYRVDSKKSAASVADFRDSIVAGEENFKRTHPNAIVEYNTDMRIAEVLGPDAKRVKFEWLTSPSRAGRPEILRNFVKDNANLIGVNNEQVDALEVTADYTNPAGNMSYVHLEQRINGTPVFRGELKAGFTKSGQIIRVINNLAPGLEYSQISNDFGEPEAAVRSAANVVKRGLVADDQIQNQKGSTDDVAVFGSGDIIAEKMYFPTEPGVAVPAWRVLIGGALGTQYVIVDAHTDQMLWRKNLTEDQTESATYNVYRNPNAFIDVSDSPYVLSPGPLNPGLGTQGTAVPRTMMTLVGNEAPNTFNNLGWITDGNNTTAGNNVEAGLDRKLPNSGATTANPADTDPDGQAIGTARTFDFPFNPGNPNTNLGDPPLPAGQAPATCLAQSDVSLPTNYQKAITTQLFYIINRYHDKMYELGFTEAARNFQATNFTGQGVGNDRVAAQAQDCSGTDNANFTTPADGTRPTMQMYLWTGPSPDFDGSVDAEVVIHEHTHGLSNRLHGNSAGLTTNMSRGMGEGWGDFFGYSMLAEPTDPIDGVYTTGGYATYLISAGFTANYYYGIRRFPRAPISFVGPNGKPHNPFTFQYVNSNCAALIGTTSTNPNSAYPRGPVGSATCDQVHNLGEIWSSALWEVRNRMVARLGFAAGTTRALQVVTDGMKLAPIGPTFLQERDAIVTAAAALSLAPQAAADVLDVKDGFRVRGMGFSASIQNAGTGSGNTAVTEAFDNANAQITAAFSVSDAAPGGNGNGFPDPGELVQMTVSVTNTTGAAVTNVLVSAAGGGNGVGNFGTVANGATVARTIGYAIPSAASCGNSITVPLTVTSDSGSQPPVNKTFTLGQPSVGVTENFDAAVVPALPAGWTQVQTSGTSINWTTVTTTPNSAPNAAFANEPTTVNATALVSPPFNVSSAAAVVSFKNNFNLETSTTAGTGFDGMVLEIKIGAGAFTDIVTAGGSFSAGGYNSTISTQFSNPLAGRAAWSGNSGGYITTTATLPASANGQSVQLRWLVGTDNSATATGARIDDVSVINGYTCAPFLAAGVELSGRVRAIGERGLTNARVNLTDEQGVTRTVVTGRLGTFRFEDVPAGHTYVLSVSSRRFTYAPRVIQVTDNISGIDLTPEQ